MPLLKEICAFGRDRWATRKLPGLAVSFPRPASLKYLPAGLYFLLSDLASAQFGSGNRLNLGPLPVENQTAPPPRPKELDTHSLAMLGRRGGLALEVNLVEMSKRVLSKIKANTEQTPAFTYGQLKDWVSASLLENERAPRPKQVLRYLLANYNIEPYPNENNRFRVASMVTRLQEKATSLSLNLHGVQTVSGVVSIAEKVLSKLWESSTLLIYDQADGGRVKSAALKGHGDWQLPSPIYRTALERYIESGVKALEERDCVVGVIANIPEEVKDHYDHAAEPERKQIRAAAIRGVFSASNQSRRPLLPPEENRTTIFDRLFYEISRPLAAKISELCKPTGLTVRQLLESEESRAIGGTRGTPSAGVTTIEGPAEERLWAELKQHFSIETMKFVDRLSRRKRPFEVMDLRQAAGLPEVQAAGLAGIFQRISCDAWAGLVGRRVSGYSAEFIRAHFLTERTLLARSGSGEFVAFSGINKIRTSSGLLVCLLEAGMVVPTYQNMRITTRLMGRMLSDELIANGLEPFIAATRSANPQVIGAMQIFSEVFPNVRDPEAQPEPWQREVFQLVHQRLNPGSRADENNFVVDDVYPLESGLVIPVHRLPVHRDRAAMELCGRLDYERYNRPEFFAGELDQLERAKWQALQAQLPGGLPGADRAAALNRLITDPLLAVKLEGAISGLSDREYLDYLLKLTREDRTKVFSALETGAQETIKYANRLLLEKICPELPKRLSKAMIVLGKVTAEARRAHQARERKHAINDFFLSTVKWLIR